MVIIRKIYDRKGWSEWGERVNFDGSGNKYNFGNEFRDRYRNENMKYFLYDIFGYIINEFYSCYRDICIFKFFVFVLIIVGKWN